MFCRNAKQEVRISLGAVFLSRICVLLFSRRIPSLSFFSVMGAHGSGERICQPWVGRFVLSMGWLATVESFILYIYFNGASISPFAECFVNNKESKEEAILTKWSPFPLNVYFQVTFSLPLQSLLLNLPVECPKADRFFVGLFLLFF